MKLKSMGSESAGSEKLTIDPFIMFAATSDWNTDHRSLVYFVVGASFLSYLIFGPLATALHWLLESARGDTFEINHVEKGVPLRQDELSDEALFELEKRAFLSRTWLYACHRSRFERPGDYYVFEEAGISFFVVLGKDHQVRAFHNVCRHRAYTVVRKSCGTTTRFACRYHGWQYDDQGKLLKAPKFDEQPGFLSEDNGLWEIKLVQTTEGLLFVNFDANTMDLPFNDVSSRLQLAELKWLDGMDLAMEVNWKQIANYFTAKARQSRVSFGWLRMSRRPKTVELLGPLSVAIELDPSVWATVTVLPRSMLESSLRIDLYSQEGRQLSKAAIDRWRWSLEEEMTAVGEKTLPNGYTRAGYSYECGGRWIDLEAILAQHQRSEKQAQRKLQPAIRVTGFEVADTDAAELCDAVDAMVETRGAEMPPCAKVSSFTQRLDW